MKRIDIVGVCKAANLDLKLVAAQLFPKNTHPTLALNRVISKSNKAVLDANQISKLSALTGVNIGDLFTPNKWKTAKSSKNTLTFQSEEYLAELNTTDWTTKVFSNNGLKHKFIIHGGAITLSEYFTKLNSEIVKID